MALQFVGASKLLILGCFCLVIVTGCGQVSDPARADDTAAESAPPAEASWEELAARMKAIEARVNEIRAEFDAADAARKAELRTEFNQLATELQRDIFPDLALLAPARLEEFPDDLVAAELVMQQMFNSNRFAEAAQLADQILAELPDNNAALNFGGMAHFAIHNFQRSHEILEHARSAGLLVDRLPRDDGSAMSLPEYLEHSQNYIDYWTEEQAIREREAAAEGEELLPQVRLTTSRGEILLELFENEAPNTVANFISLVEEGYYDGLKFHRVIPWFMAQGGCPNTRAGAAGLPGQGGPGYRIECECFAENARRHFAGSLSMAHAGRDTGGSQFFITHLPTPLLNVDYHPEIAHTVFGRVVEGMDVVAALEIGDVIESAEVVRKRNHPYEPTTLPPR